MLLIAQYSEKAKLQWTAMAVYLSHQAEHRYTIAKMATPATTIFNALTLTRPVSP